MNFTRKTLSWDASTSDAAALCEQLVPGTWATEGARAPLPRHDPALLLGHAIRGSVMALSLTSSTAIGLTLGPALIERLAQLGLAVDLLAGLALHELIVNAVVHGNLGVKSGCSDAWQDLSERQSALTASLADPLRAGSLITIALGWTARHMVAAIADEGNGYNVASLPSSGRASGRGLRIARAVGRVDVLDGGCLTAITLECCTTTHGGGR